MGLLSRIGEKIKKSAEERRRRANRPFMVCAFDEGISQEQFRQLAHEAVDSIKKRHVEIAVHGPIIEGIVWSNTNLSSWRFKVDFNDYGHISGNYWLQSDNDQSIIPKSIAEKVSFEIIRIRHDLEREDGGTTSE